MQRPKVKLSDLFSLFVIMHLLFLFFFRSSSQAVTFVIFSIAFLGQRRCGESSHKLIAVKEKNPLIHAETMRNVHYNTVLKLVCGIARCTYELH